MSPPSVTFKHNGYVPGRVLCDPDRYLAYLRSIEGKIPPDAHAYAAADWHWDAHDHRCPHDAWIEFVTVQELSRGERSEIREIAVKARALGAYHDGHFEITYSGVTSHCIELPTKSFQTGYGDWLTDEVRLADNGKVVHEVLFASGGHWLIECADLRHQWLPLDSPCPHCSTFERRQRT